MNPYEAYGTFTNNSQGRIAGLDNWSEQVLNMLYRCGVSNRFVGIADVDVSTVGQHGEADGPEIARLISLPRVGNVGGVAGQFALAGGRGVVAAGLRGL
jgi:hypothetical protein